MKINLKKALLSTVLMLSTSASVFAENLSQQHRHEHESTPQSLALDNGVKWQIDQSLHLGMVKIKQALVANLDAIHYDKFSAAQYAALAEQVDQQLSYLFKHCKLPVQADAQLHILLAKVMGGSVLMKNSVDQKQGAIAIMQALQDYPIYFNDANWQVFDH